MELFQYSINAHAQTFELKKAFVKTCKERHDTGIAKMLKNFQYLAKRLSYKKKRLSLKQSSRLLN